MACTCGFSCTYVRVVLKCSEGERVTEREKERERERGEGALTEGESRYVRTKQNILDQQLKGTNKDY